MGGENLYQYAPNPLAWIDPLGLKWIKGYQGKKPDYVNPGHHQKGHPEFRGGGVNKTSLIPCHSENLYKHSIPDAEGKNWYAIDDKGVVHQFKNGNDGTVHWAGDSSQGKGVILPQEVKQRVNNGKIKKVNSVC